MSGALYRTVGSHCRMVNVIMAYFFPPISNFLVRFPYLNTPFNFLFYFLFFIFYFLFFIFLFLGEWSMGTGPIRQAGQVSGRPLTLHALL